MPDYDIDLTNWVPKYLLTTSSAHRGEAVEETDWNDRWNLLRDVSDYNTQTVANTLAALVLSVWHATNGAASIKHPALPYDTRAVVDQSLNVSGQLLWLDSQNKDRTDAIAALAAVVAAMPVTHAALPDLDGADAHPISAITGLQAALDGIVAGDMAAINHNLLGSRDAAGAHPLAAITGLSEWKTAYDLIAARNHNDWPNRNAAGAHTGAAITYDATNTVTQKIGALEAAIQGITGGIAEMSFSVSNSASRFCIRASSSSARRDAI
jgi:hypothetical protein